MPDAVATCVVSFVCLVVAMVPAAAAAQPAYLDPSRPAAERAADLVSRMTLDEKAGQLSTTNAPAIPRLGVAAYAYWSEAQHGLSAFYGGYKDDPARFTTPRATSFPTNLSASLTWNPELMRRETSAISDEARGELDKSLFGKAENDIGNAATNYGNLVYWAPTVNLARDPRWGRTDEAFGEDPFLVGTMGAAWVDGFQGQDAAGRLEDHYLKAIATEKHFALNNNEKDRMATSSDTDETTIREYFTAQFRRIVEDAHVAGVMSSYNAVNGTPTAVNDLLMNVLLRKTWGFAGYTTSDCGAVGAIYRNPQVDRTPVSLLNPALNESGHDWAPPGFTTDHGDMLARWTNARTGTTVDATAGAEAYALRAGTTLNCVGAGSDDDEGLWDALRGFMGAENAPATIAAAIKAGVLSEAVIDRGLIDVLTQRFRVGEFDPVARQRYTTLGKGQIESGAHRALAQAVAEQAVTLLQDRAPAGAAAALLPADPAATHQVVVLGDQADKVFLGGYSGKPSEQVPLLEGITRIVPGAQVTYDAAGTSSTATSAPTLSDATKAAIHDADLVVVMVGTDSGTNQEGNDRTSLRMPGNYGQLIDAVAAVGNPRIALVVQSAGPIDLTTAQGKVAAILYSAANGQRQGVAMANALFGRTDPSGHLSFTWYRGDAQLPPMMDYDITPAKTGGLGRTYQYFTGTPLYPFGYGGSYTRFRFAHVRLDRARADVNGVVRVRLVVRNTGTRAGATVAELYASSPQVPGREVPRRRLVGFRRTAELAPGRSQRLTIKVPLATALRLWDPAARRSFVPTGRWRLSLATSATDVVRNLGLRLTGRISRRLARLVLDPAGPIMAVGATQDLMGTNAMYDGLAPALADPGDHVLTAVRFDDSFAALHPADVRFSSSSPTVATVDRSGRLRANGPGAAMITAAAGGVRASAPVVVR